MRTIPYTNIPEPTGPTGADWEADTIPAALAVARYGVARSTLSKWARDGVVRAFKLGKNWYYHEPDVIRMAG